MRDKRKTFWRRIWVPGIAIVGIPILAIGIWTIFYFNFLAAAGTWTYPVLPEGSLWKKCMNPEESGRMAPDPLSIQSQILENWARRPLDPANPRNAPRVLLAKLALNRGPEEANAFIQQMQPWAGTGGEWDVREAFGYSKDYSDRIRLGHRGDYDFATTIFVTSLNLFGNQPERLYPETVNHLVTSLLTEKGGKPRLAGPMSFGMVADSENHILMTESSRYLTNQWLHLNGNPSPEYDNATNGLEEWLVSYLTSLRDGGMQEFNSRPYVRLSLEALLNLQAFAQGPQVKALAREILDAANWNFAFGSMDLRRNAPFRRQMSRSTDTSLQVDPQSTMMGVWLGRLPPEWESRVSQAPSALTASLIPYSLPEGIAEISNMEAFVRIGRGPAGSPEIYSRAPGFLLSAGGAGISRGSQIVPRQITLMLADGATELEECFYIEGRGPLHSRNLTGGTHRFACGPSPVHTPKGNLAVVRHGPWSLHGLPKSRWWLAVYSSSGFGLIALLPRTNDLPESLLQDLAKLNPVEQIKREFNSPEGRTISYEVDAPMGKWVIKSDSSYPTISRNWTNWPRMEGWMK